MSYTANEFSKFQGSPYVSLTYKYAPKLNGGLFTGQPFEKGAPWGNFPVEPETGAYINKNLMSANPPPLARYHYPGAEHRPGNNTPELPGIVKCGDYGFYAIDDDRMFTKDCLTYCALTPKTNSC